MCPVTAIAPATAQGMRDQVNCDCMSLTEFAPICLTDSDTHPESVAAAIIVLRPYVQKVVTHPAKLVLPPFTGNPTLTP